MSTDKTSSKSADKMEDISKPVGATMDRGGAQKTSLGEAGNGVYATLKTNPLLNNVVLRNVFKYGLSLEDVKRNRLVCKTWLEASNSQWTKLAKTLTLYRGEEGSTGEGKTLNELWDLCKEAKGPLEKTIRHRNFLFQGWTFDQALLKSLRNAAGDSEGGIAAENWLWNRLAPNLITDLTLDSCRFPVEFTPFTENFLRVLPNLERLTVENCVVSNDVLGIRQANEVDVDDVFVRLENAVDMEVEVLGWEQVDLEQVILAVFRRDPMEEFRDDEAEAEPQLVHEKLKFLKLKTSPDQKRMMTKLVTFLVRVPNVETIVLQGFDVKGLSLFFQDLERAPSTRQSLKKLDVLDLSSEALDYGMVGKCGDFHYSFEGLNTLHYDLGYQSAYAGQDLSSIQYKMMSLEELHLYRAPFVEPYPSAQFFRGTHMATRRSCFLNITQLHLWGNLADSLDFLIKFPRLTTLVMNTSCYEESYHGRRTYQVMEKGFKTSYPVMERDLVKSTTSLEITRLTKLEIDWTLKSAKSWSQLATWMPNLVTLKARIMNQSQLAEIRKLFGSLEDLELAHGSMISEEGVLKELPHFPKLRTFSWKICPCNERERLWEDDVSMRLRDLGQKLGIQLYRKSVEPWTLPSDQGKVFLENSWSRRTRSGSKICIQAEYEKMLKTGDSREYLKMIKI